MSNVIKFTAELTKEYILQRVSEEEIFEAYGAKVVDYPFCSPFRRDINPTCRFYRRRRDNRLILRDMAGYFWGDCFDLVAFVTPGIINYYKALKDIAARFKLQEGPTSIIRIPQTPRVNIQQVECEIRVTRMEWTERHLEYWKQYHVQKSTLERFKVAPLELAWLNGQQIYSWHAKNEPAYVYYFGGYDYKLYFPTRERGSIRFMHNNPNILQGYEQLPVSGRGCVITKSLKDVICLAEYDVPAVAPMSEMQILSEVSFEELSSRFDKLFCLYDVDNPYSIASMKAMRNMGIQPLFFKRSQPKDFSDFIKEFGRQNGYVLVEYFTDLFF